MLLQTHELGWLQQRLRALMVVNTTFYSSVLIHSQRTTMAPAFAITSTNQLARPPGIWAAHSLRLGYKLILLIGITALFPVSAFIKCCWGNAIISHKIRSNVMWCSLINRFCINARQLRS